VPCQSSDDESPREQGFSGSSMLGVLERLNLMRAIRKLPRGYKQFFLLYDVLGYEHKEIAGLSGCSTGCSKSQLHKARKTAAASIARKTRGERKPISPPRKAEIRQAPDRARRTFFALITSDHEFSDFRLGAQARARTHRCSFARRLRWIWRWRATQPRNYFDHGHPSIRSHFARGNRKSHGAVTYRTISLARSVSGC
jgi:Sigma-70, region 4